MALQLRLHISPCNILRSSGATWFNTVTSQQNTKIPNFCSSFLAQTDISSVQHIYDNISSGATWFNTTLSQQFTKIPNFCSFFWDQTDIISVQYIYDNDKVSIMTAGVPADLPNISQKDYCLSQLAHLHSLQNTPSLNLLQLHDRCHFLKHKFKNCEQLAWLQSFTLSFRKNSGKQNLVWQCLCCVSEWNIQFQPHADHRTHQSTLECKLAVTQDTLTYVCENTHTHMHTRTHARTFIYSCQHWHQNIPSAPYFSSKWHKRIASA